jgi:hypothetical protein
MSKAINNLFWHDGNLLDALFSIDKRGTSFVKITASLYKDEQSSNRTSFQINCEGVSRFSSMLDANELKDNMSAGNISSGYLKENTLWIYLSDGLIEVQAKRFHLTKC